MGNETVAEKNRQNLFLNIIEIILFIGAVVWFTVLNFHNIKKGVGEYIHRDITIQELNTEVNKRMKSDSLYLKDQFININGLYGRLTGRRLYNNVLLLKNGYLTNNLGSLRNIGQTEALSDFSNFVKERGGHYIYGVFPTKLDFEKKLLPDGIKTTFPDDVQKFISAHRSAGVDVVDFYSELGATAEDITNNFYRTDHHWTVMTAFKAFQILMGHLRELYPDEPFPAEVENWDNWTIHEIPDHFLGSWGKRVGLYFDGIDPLYYMTPNFSTDLSFCVPKIRSFKKGTAEDVFIDKSYLEPGGNKLRIHYHAVFLGDNYPITMSRNQYAPSDLKLLVFQNSYFRPMLPFLAMVFKEIDVIDPRLYSTTSLKEYVDRTRPDLVMTAFHANAMADQVYHSFTFEDDIYLNGEKKLLLEEDHIDFAANDNKNNLKKAFTNFENETVYTASISHFTITKGETDAVSIGLFDIKNKKTIQETMFDIEYCNSTGNCKWTFETPESGSKNLELRIYSGLVGQTVGIGVNWDNFKLYENGTR